MIRPLTRDEILEAHDLLAGTVEHPDWPELDRIFLRGAFTALHWAVGCDCEWQREFNVLLVKLRAQRDQVEAQARGSGG